MQVNTFLSMKCYVLGVIYQSPRVVSFIELKCKIPLIECRPARFLWYILSIEREKKLNKSQDYNKNHRNNKTMNYS